MEERVTPNGQEDFWDFSLAVMDSDEDAYSNGQELQDRTGEWREGLANPGEFRLVTNPGFNTDFPSGPPLPTPTATPTPTPNSARSWELYE